MLESGQVYYPDIRGRKIRSAAARSDARAGSRLTPQGSGEPIGETVPVSKGMVRWTMCETIETQVVRVQWFTGTRGSFSDRSTILYPHRALGAVLAVALLLDTTEKSGFSFRRHGERKG